jgi:hypothetical protein
VPSKHQFARVAVSDETWLEFRRAALGQGVSIAAYLGRLVDAEVKRRSARTVGGLDSEAPDRDQAFAALADVRASIDELDGIAGRLARTAIAHGGTWADVASSLRLPTAQPVRAYDRDG